MKTHATEKWKRQKTHRKPTENQNYIHEFQCFLLIISIQQISSCVYFVQQHIPTVIWLGLITFYCLNSSARSCADIPVFHVSIGIWWHKEINLVQIYLPFLISNSALTFTEESLFMLADHISTQHSVWKLLYPAVDLGFLDLTKRNHLDDVSVSQVCENIKKVFY